MGAQVIGSVACAQVTARCEQEVKEAWRELGMERAL